MANSKIFSEFDKKYDLAYALSLAMNFVPNDINHLFDRQRKLNPEDVTNGYAPHLPIEVL